MDYTSFIPSHTIREHLGSLPPLPPALQCIIIAKSRCRSLAEKLNALRAIRENTPVEAFAEGNYGNVGDKEQGALLGYPPDPPFVEVLDNYIFNRQMMLEEFLRETPSAFYSIKAGDSFLDGMLFTTFKDAIYALKHADQLEDCGDIYDGGLFSSSLTPIFIRRVEKDGFPWNGTITASLTFENKIRDVWRDNSDSFSERTICGTAKDLPEYYAEIPHPFKPGDIVSNICEFFVVTGEAFKPGHDNDHFGRDDDTMRLEVLRFEKNVLHSCGCCFRHEELPILELERGKASELPEESRILSKVSPLIAQTPELASFLEAYSTRKMIALAENNSGDETNDKGSVLEEC